ncbi:MAG: class II aldolase/adducin family protein [Hyphomicrobiales bacterium]|nr:class II aldolase/adducin family protein [Hyphomicrobiales bacterium]
MAEAAPIALARLPQLIGDLVAANRILAQHGILDAFGHVSIRHPDNPDHYLMSRWLAPALVGANDIVEYDLESVALTHPGVQLYSERYIHSEIYKVRPDVHAIVHSHSPTVVPFSVTKATFRPILHNAAFLGTDVPVFDIREKFGPTDMLVNRKERGTEVARILGSHSVALMRGHGNVVVGRTIQNVVWRAYYTEVNARMLATAVALDGGPIEYLSAEETQLTDVAMQRVEARPWALWKEKACGN